MSSNVPHGRTVLADSCAQDVQWVRQEDPQGCAPAVVAMLTGRTYEDVRAQIDAEHDHGHSGDWTTDGITHVSIDRILIEHGFYLQRWYEHFAPEWPPLPWAPVHFASVKQPSGNSHFVVMRADGMVLDPLREGEYRLTHWPGVNNVVGLLR